MFKMLTRASVKLVDRYLPDPLQPFRALPVPAIAGLKAKDIMSFCLIQLFLTGIVISVGLIWF